MGGFTILVRCSRALILLYYSEVILKLLSIIIPTFNRVELIKKLMDGLSDVLDWPEIEFIVVDDCSTQSVRCELNDLSRKYTSVSFIFLSKNTGGAGARNKGAELSKSRWIWFLDDDDFVDGKRVIAICEGLNEIDTKNKLIFLAANFIHEKGSRLCCPSGPEIFKKFSRYGNEVNTSCVIFDSIIFNKIGGWDGDLVAGQDTDILLRAAELTDAYVFHDIFVDVLLHDGERITTNPKKQLKAKYQFIVKNYKRLHFIRLARYVFTLLIAYPYMRRLIWK